MRESPSGVWTGIREGARMVFLLPGCDRLQPVVRPAGQIGGDRTIRGDDHVRHDRKGPDPELVDQAVPEKGLDESASCPRTRAALEPRHKPFNELRSRSTTG